MGAAANPGTQVGAMISISDPVVVAMDPHRIGRTRRSLSVQGLHLNCLSHSQKTQPAEEAANGWKCNGCPSSRYTPSRLSKTAIKQLKDTPRLGYEALRQRDMLVEDMLCVKASQFCTLARGVSWHDDRGRIGFAKWRMTNERRST